MKRNERVDGDGISLHSQMKYRPGAATPEEYSASLPDDVKARCTEDHVYRFATIANMYKVLKSAMQELRAGALMLHKQGKDILDEVQTFAAAGMLAPKGALDVLMTGAMQDRSVAHVLRMMHKQICSEIIGHQFAVKAELTRHLLNTHIKGVTTDMLRLPFPLIYVKLPRGLGLGLSVKDYRGEEYEAEGFYANDTTVNGKRAVRVSIIGASYPEDVLDDASVDFLIYLPEGVLLVDAFEEAKHKWLQENTGVPPDWFIQGAFAIWTLLANIVLYISCTNADVSRRVNPEWEALQKRMHKLPKTSKKRERLKAKLRSTPKNEIIVLGAHLEQTAKRRRGSNTLETSQRKTMLRHEVRGHWRQVWRGSLDPQKQEALGERRQVLKWIEPYSKGVDIAEAIKRKTYVVGGT